MAKKKSKNNTISNIINMALLVPSLYKMLRQIGHVFVRETKIAGKSVVWMSILMIFSAFLLMSTWISLLAILFFFFNYLGWGNIISSSIILLINLVLMSIIGLIMLKLKNSLSFPETRKQIARSKRDADLI